MRVMCHRVWSHNKSNNRARRRRRTIVTQHPAGCNTGSQLHLKQQERKTFQETSLIHRKSANSTKLKMKPQPPPTCTLRFWWVYCFIEAISSRNVWIDFAKITLAKLCVRTCCNRHESSSSSRSLPWIDGGTDEQRDEQRRRMKKEDHPGYIYIYI